MIGSRSRGSLLPRIFLDTFTARDIAEPLLSFDLTAAAPSVREVMEAKQLVAVGLRTGGMVSAFVTRQNCTGDACEEYAVPIDETLVVDETAPLVEVVKRLNHAPICLVRILGEVGGIITRDDLQKAPVRMWLFGLVTLIEMRLSSLIESQLPDDAWKEYLSYGRLAKAQAILEERRRRHQSPRLFDCLQFADKGTIAASHEAIRAQTVFTSRRHAEETMRKLEGLRNSLAHAQDIIANDWETIVRLCDFVTQRSAANGSDS
jgi:hypothetical protein